MTSNNLILHNAQIWKNAHAAAPVDSIAIQGSKVLGAGTFQELSGLLHSSAEQIDLEGRTVIPGLIDAHVHLEQFARQLSQLDCSSKTLEACLGQVKDAAAKVRPGNWILGHAWDQNVWGQYGTAADLDRVAEAFPVYLTAKSMHAAWTNSLGLRKAGIDAQTPDPAGGEIVRDQLGNPTGILFENAMQLVSDQIPKSDVQKTSTEIQKAQEVLWINGITGLHDFDGERCLRALQTLHGRGELGLRILKTVPVDLLPHAKALGIQNGFGDDWIRIGHVKAFADGALGPRTASMLAAYQGEPSNLGISLLDKEEVLEIGIQAAQSGLPIAIHAIGDRANHDVFDAIDALRQFEREQGLPNLRHRVEHLQLLHGDDLKRPGKLKIVASMQPLHATADMLMADQYWGSRVETAYAWKSIQDGGATLAFGSDAPVEDPNPFLGLHAAVTRRRVDGSPNQDGWTHAQKLDLRSALAGFTLGASFVAGNEQRQGHLETGAFADLIVLDRDIFKCEPDEIHSIHPVGTMVGGNWKLQEF
jgi:predicted amidohydrolase YtcJ